MNVKSDPRLRASLKNFSEVASLAVMLLGGLVLFGWVFDIDALKSILPGLASMKVNTALSFIIAGATLWLLQGEPSPLKRRLALTGAIFVAALALLTLSQDMFGWNLGLDQLLFRDTPPAGSTAPPGRMSPATAFNFSLLGGALLLWIVKREQGWWITQLLALLVGIVALLALVGYAYSVQSLYHLAPFSSMALHTALAFLSLSLAILAACAERGIGAAIIAPTAGGLMLRRLLPAALILPIVLGWIRLQGQYAGLYDTEVGLALFALSNVAIFTGLVWWTARLFQRTDAERKQAEEQFRLVVEASPNAIILVNPSGGIHLVNAQAETLFGYTRQELLGQQVEILVPLEVRAGHQDYRNNFLKTPTARAMGAGRDLYGLRQDGRQVPIEIGLNPITTTEGRFVLASIIDITQRKRVEEALRLSEDNFARAFNSSPAALAITRLADEKFLSLNEAYSRIMGYEPVEILGRTAADMNIYVNPDERDYLIQQLREQRAVRNYELLVRHKSGQVRSLLVSMEPTLYNNEKTIISTFLDITDRKRVEEALKKSETSLAKAQQIAQLGSWELDLVNLDDVDSNNLRWSDEVYRIFGYNPGEIEPSNELFFQAVPSDEIPLIQQGVAQAIAEKKTFSMEHHIVLADGTERIVHEYGDVICDELTGQPLQLFGIIQDITERKQVEAQIHYQAALVENVSDAIIATDINFNITSWNKAAETIYGWPAQEVLGQPSTVVLKTDYIENGQRQQVIEQLFETGQWTGEVIQHHKDGAAIYILASVSLLHDRTGQPVGVVTVNRDISDRKQAEQARTYLAAIVESSQDAIIGKDLQGTILSWNSGAERIFGYSADEIIGQPITRLIPPDRLEEEEQILSRLKQGRQVNSFETLRLNKQGQLIDVSVTISPIRNILGEVIGASKVAHDITARKRAEEGLRQTAADLARSNAELEQFAYVASHDLQEPLRAVASTIQLLQKRYAGQLDDRADEFIKHAVEGAARMQALIHDLLAFSRVGSRDQSIQPTDSGAALTKALANLVVTIQETGAIITHDPLPIVKGDAGQLVQLFQNLIGNAIKFRGDKTPTVHIGVERQNGDWLFSVRDNGIGIQSEYFERIFVVFQRLHTRREYQGTGIGLAICKKIIDRHGGRIWVESEVGQGTCFYFTLSPERDGQHLNQ